MLAELARISHGNANPAGIGGIDFDITNDVRRVDGSADKGASGEFAVEPAGCGQEKRPFAAADRRVGNPEHGIWRWRVQAEGGPAHTIVRGFVCSVVQTPGIKIAITIEVNANWWRVVRQRMRCPTISRIGADGNFMVICETDMVRVQGINGDHPFSPKARKIVRGRWSYTRPRDRRAGGGGVSIVRAREGAAITSSGVGAVGIAGGKNQRRIIAA